MDHSQIRKCAWWFIVAGGRRSSHVPRSGHRRRVLLVPDSRQTLQNILSECGVTCWAVRVHSGFSLDMGEGKVRSSAWLITSLEGNSYARS